MRPAVGMADSVKRPSIVAHRGCSAFAPENTFAAFSLALESGAEGIEMDVRLTRDGVPVVFHDAGLKRISGSDIRISSLTFGELAEVDAGSWFNLKNAGRANRRFVGEKIPTLESTMEFLHGFHGPIYVELKSAGRNARTLADAAGKVLSRHTGELNIIVKSFNFELIPLVREICPKAESAALFAPQILLILKKESRLISIAKKLGVNRLSLHYSLATRSLLRRANKERLPVTIWTTDSERWVRASIELGIDSIITNDPAKLIALRDREQGSNSRL